MKKGVEVSQSRVAPRPRGHDLVIIANRLPVTPSADDDGEWEISPGGLVRALLPTVRRLGAAWVGWSGATGASPDDDQAAGVALVPVELSADDVEEYYDGFSNQTLWPLYHDVTDAVVIEREWWDAYVQVNQRFAEAAATAAAPGAAVWVHDYHLQLVPQMLRELRPDVRIGFFLHIPFPPHELFARLPWREAILEGVLGADLVSFQTDQAARNFMAVAIQLTSATPAEFGLRIEGRAVPVGAHPISIDVDEIEELAGDPKTIEAALTARELLGNPKYLLLGVDRLDSTKAIDQRLTAYRRLLQSGRVAAEDCVLVQIAVPSRERCERYTEERRRVEQLVSEINHEFASVGRNVVQYLYRNHSLEELVALYRAADVMVVTPWRDGMNLVAKEYVAARIDGEGALVLSEFAGAAQEFTDALLVNPYDEDGIVEALYHALMMPLAESRRRMLRLRRMVASHDVHHWASGFLRSLHVPTLARQTA
jgi:trehalose 6-phosphate synthase